MKQENLGLLLRLISNYVNNCENLQEAKSFLREVAEYPSHELSYGAKKVIYEQCVAALNCGCEEAERDAFEIRLKALCSSDEEFTEKIEYLHEVL